MKTEAKLSSLKAGLLRVSFDRQAKQGGNEGFIAPTLLGKIVGDAQPLPTNALEDLPTLRIRTLLSLGS